jgi:hypothetical protein
LASPRLVSSTPRVGYRSENEDKAAISERPAIDTVSFANNHSTLQQQQNEDALLLKQALQRPKPLAVLGTSDSLSYQTPMLDFVARDYTPQVEYTASLPQPSTGGVLVSSILGAICVLGGLFSLGMGVASNKNSPPSTMDIVLGGILLVGGLALPVYTYRRYKKQQNDFLKNPPQPILRNIFNPQQSWINRSMVQMMELTNIRATLGEGSKALKVSTGDTFAKQLSRRENRLLAEETQALQEMHNRQMEAKAEEALEAANATAEYTAQVANQTNPYYPFNLLG